MVDMINLSTKLEVSITTIMKIGKVMQKMGGLGQ